MERNPPDWLNKEFLAEALQKEEGRHEKVKVLKFTAKPATAVGDNYTSHMFRVHLTLKEGSSPEEEEKMVILKAPKVTGVIKELTDECNIYDLEPSIYKDILPKMYKMIKIHLGPKMYYCNNQGAMVLQDLKTDGYTVCDRFKLLDFAHCKLFYEALAKYHATSVALHYEVPDLIEDLGKEKNFSADAPFAKVLIPWTKSALKNFIEVIKEIDGEQAFIDFLQSKVETIFDSLVISSKIKPDRLNVLNHGDCWTNNMMFKHDCNQQVVDVKLIDFQLPRYNTPVYDLLYFLWTSANEDVRRNHEKELFEAYLYTLNKTLEEIGCKERLTQKELDEEIRCTSDFVIWTVSFVQLFMLCEPELVLDMEKFTSEECISGAIDDRFRAIYNGKRYRELLPGVTRDLQTWLTSKSIIARKS